MFFFQLAPSWGNKKTTFQFTRGLGSWNQPHQSQYFCTHVLCQTFHQLRRLLLETASEWDHGPKDHWRKGLLKTTREWSLTCRETLKKHTHTHKEQIRYTSLFETWHTDGIVFASFFFLHVMSNLLLLQALKWTLCSYHVEPSPKRPVVQHLLSQGLCCFTSTPQI